jgi:hypothetical protein
MMIISSKWKYAQFVVERADIRHEFGYVFLPYNIAMSDG